MSMASLRIARDARGMTGPQKAVLYVLADMANDAMECWPSVAALAEVSCFSERTVQDALSALRATGQIAIQPGGGRGRTTCYIIRNGAGAAPIGGDGKGAPPAGKGAGAASLEGTERVQEARERVHLPRKRVQLAPKRVQEAHPEASGSQKKPQEAGGGRATRSDPGEGPNPHGTRLPADWQPGEIEVAFAQSQGLDPTAVAERFRDFWHGKAGQGGRKLNWTSTWRNWCREDAERAQRRGSVPPQRFTKPSNLDWMLEELPGRHHA